MIGVLVTHFNLVRGLHILSVIAFMAGLLYLPRLFVYHAGATPGSEMDETFKVMERRLLRGIINPASIATFVFGLLLIAADSRIRGADFLLGGVDLAFECTGGASGLDTSLRLVRAGGTVVVSGMPSGGVDLTPLWYRELKLVGAYASGRGSAEGGSADAGARPPSGHADGADFADALRLAGTAPLDGYVGTTYPLARWREALNHAADAGRLGTVKVAFDLAR